MENMYAPQNNGPHTVISAAINSADTTILVDDAGVLPEAPNVLTLGLDEDAELVLLLSRAGNILTVERGFNGTAAKSWDIGHWVYRAITAQGFFTIVALFTTQPAHHTYECSHPQSRWSYRPLWLWRQAGGQRDRDAETAGFRPFQHGVVPPKAR